jgi:hypothetical protein
MKRTAREEDMEHLARVVAENWLLSVFWIQDHPRRRTKLIEEMELNLISIGYPWYRIEKP